jgi:uncharacterized protein HemY
MDDLAGRSLQNATRFIDEVVASSRASESVRDAIDHRRDPRLLGLVDVRETKNSASLKVASQSLKERRSPHTLRLCDSCVVRRDDTR